MELKKWINTGSPEDMAEMRRRGTEAWKDVQSIHEWRVEQGFTISISDADWKAQCEALNKQPDARSRELQ